MKVFSYSIWSIHYYVCWSCKAEWRDTLIEDTYRSSIIIYCKSTIFDCTKTFPLPLKKWDITSSIQALIYVYSFIIESVLSLIFGLDLSCKSGTKISDVVVVQFFKVLLFSFYGYEGAFVLSVLVILKRCAFIILYRYCTMLFCTDICR